LTTTAIPELITDKTLAGTSVTLFSRDRSGAVAHGLVSHSRPLKFNGVNVTKTQILFQVMEVLIPSYCIPPDLIDSHISMPLSDFGPPPFTILCHSKHLRTKIGDLTPHAISGKSGPSTSLSLKSTGKLRHVPSTDSDQGYINEGGGVDTLDDDSQTNWYLDMDMGTREDQDPLTSFCDLLSEQKGNQLLSEFTDNIHVEPVVRSCVLGDCWHLMHQFTISIHHGLR
jgi:hypothetical protein